MARALYKASAPGSMMLSGEHAVLYGKLATAFAINKRITVTLVPREDQEIHIFSALGEIVTTLDTLKPEKPLQFVLAALANEKHLMQHGCDLTIESELASTVGVGSSAAVTVATIAVLAQWIEKQTLSPESLFKRAKQVIHDVQGVGSGADAAASIYGGVIAFRTAPLLINKLPHRPPITVVYSGHKKPTHEVVQQVAAHCDKHPLAFADIYSAMDKISHEIVSAIQYQNWETLGALADIHQGLMDAIGVNEENLSEIISALRQNPEIHGAKISGSGLGDCVVGIGSTSPQLKKKQHKHLPLEISEQGLQYE